MTKSLIALIALATLTTPAFAAQDSCAQFPTMSKLLSDAKKGTNTTSAEIHDAMKSALAATTADNYWEPQICANEIRKTAPENSELQKTARALLLEYLHQNDDNQRRLQSASVTKKSFVQNDED